MDDIAVLAVGGNRLRWDDLPPAIRRAIEDGLGAAVVGADTREGGFSPGLASVLTLADGQSVFAKAISAARSSFTPTALRREAEVLARLPADVPAPRLRWTYDDGDWVVLVTDAIDGRCPRQPWVPDELARYLDAANVLADRLRTAPIPAPTVAEVYGPEFGAWPRHADALPPALRDRADDLARIEEPWAAAVAGPALLHGDLRSDNLLLTETGFVAVDWPSVTIGARWLDLLFALPSVAMHGGGDPDELWRSHPLGHEADPDAVDAALAAVAGFFIARSTQPEIPFLPTIRAFQRAQGLATLRWLATRRGWPL